MTTFKPELSKHICEHAISCWGTENQLDMVVEELAELQKSLMKYRRYKHTEQWRRNCVEEAADVSIMLEQLILMVSDNAEFEKTRAYKLNRLRQMLDSQMPKQTCEGCDRVELL
jgi:hypothetical protein